MSSYSPTTTSAASRLDYLSPHTQQLSSPLLCQPRVLLHLLTHFVGLHDALSILQQTCKHAQYEVRCIRSKLLEDENQIRVLSEQISKKPNLSRLIRDSICPSIYGHSDIKMALALALFSGVPKQSENGHIRNVLNVILLGDATNTTKTQFFEYIQTLTHHAHCIRAEHGESIGTNSALIKSDPDSVCLISSFEELSDTDQHLILDPIPILTDGTPNARCTVIATANLLTSQYDVSKTFSANIKLTEGIRSQFDIRCVLPDVVDMIVHDGNNISMQQLQPHLPPDILRAYIHHAQICCQPRLSKDSQMSLTRAYTDMRHKSSSLPGATPFTIRQLEPFTIRQLESLIRITQAHAKMHLREEAILKDVTRAIQVGLESYVSSQAFDVMRELREDFDTSLTAGMDRNERLLYLLSSMVNKQMDPHLSLTVQMQQPTRIPYSHFRSKAAELSIDQSIYEPFLLNQTSQLCRQLGFELSLDRTWIVKTFKLRSLTTPAAGVVATTTIDSKEGNALFIVEEVGEHTAPLSRHIIYNWTWYHGGRESARMSALAGPTLCNVPNKYGGKLCANHRASCPHHKKEQGQADRNRAVLAREDTVDAMFAQLSLQESQITPPQPKPNILLVRGAAEYTAATRLRFPDQALEAGSPIEISFILFVGTKCKEEDLEQFYLAAKEFSRHRFIVIRGDHPKNAEVFAGGPSTGRQPIPIDGAVPVWMYMLQGAQSLPQTGFTDGVATVNKLREAAPEIARKNLLLITTDMAKHRRVQHAIKNPELYFPKTGGRPTQGVALVIGCSRVELGWQDSDQAKVIKAYFDYYKKKNVGVAGYTDAHAQQSAEASVNAATPRLNALAMERVLQQLGFTRVICLLDPFIHTVQQQLDDICTPEVAKQADSFALFFSGHGMHHAGFGTSVMTSDCKALYWRQVQKQFYGQPEWHNKPKLLIVESCRGPSSFDTQSLELSLAARTVSDGAVTPLSPGKTTDDTYTMDWLQLFSASHAQETIDGQYANMSHIDHDGLSGFTFQVTQHLQSSTEAETATQLFERIQGAVSRQRVRHSDTQPHNTPEVISNLQKTLKLFPTRRA